MVKLDKEFNLICSVLSPGPPPLAALGLLVDTELKTYCPKVLSNPLGNLIFSLFEIIFSTPDETLDVTPPPVKYLTVKVVLLGAIP